MLIVQALGTLRVFVSDTSIAFPARKAEELLCYLLLQRGRMLARAVVAETLWPMRPPGKALRNLSTALWRLRQTLEVAEPNASLCLLTERGTLAFTSNADCRFDVEEFERTAILGLDGSLPCDSSRLKNLKLALDLYKGDFLSGLYSDWCLSERERLRLLLVRVLKRLLFHFRLCGAYDDAIEKGHRLLALDPLQEDVHRELMRCYAQSGRRSQALEQFKLCRQILREELRIAPMPETCQLHERIRSNQLRPTPMESLSDGPLPFRRALARFSQALDTLEDAWQTLQASAAEFSDAETNL